MNPSPKASASIVVSAVIAIICSALVLLCCAFASLGVFMMGRIPSNPPRPHFFAPMVAMMLLFVVALALFGIFTGIGLIRLRRWALTSILIWSGIIVFFSAITIAFMSVIPFPPMPASADQPDMHYIRFIVIGFYALPLAIGILWLIVFTRKSVKDEFLAQQLGEPLLPGQTPPPEKPRCPLPVTVLACFLIFSAATVLAYPFFHFPLFVVIFGHLLKGPYATSIHILNLALLLATGIGLIKLKPWSYPLALGLQAFWLVSGTVTYLSPNYEQLMLQFLAQMPSTANLADSPEYLHHLRSMSFIGLLVPILVLAMLLYYRTRFLDACAATTASKQATPISL